MKEEQINLAGNLMKYFSRKVPFIKQPIRDYIKNERFKIRAKYNYYVNHLKVEDRVILYEAYHGKSFTCNPLAIFLAFEKRTDFDQFLHIIVVNEKDSFVDALPKRKNIKFVAVDNDLYLRYLATAKYLINNTSFPYYFIKREGQVYVNTWHGTPLKTLGRDIKQAGMTDHMNIQRNLLQTDILVSPNQFTYEKLLSSHDIYEIFPGWVADIGYPRVDRTLAASSKDLLSQLGVTSGTKVILYAPTWRGTVGNEADMSEQLLQDVLHLKRELGSDYTVLLKSHYFTFKYFEENQKQKLCVPNGMDTNLLLSAVDILITDYSSIFFDFLPTGRSVIFYGDDIEQYSHERGFYLPIDQLPGLLTQKLEEVIVHIKNIDLEQEKYNEKYKEYQEQFCYNDDGQAASRLLSILVDNEQKHLIKTDTKKEKIIMYCGAFYNNGITMSALTLLDAIDYDKYEVVVIENPKGSEEKWVNIKRANPNVHFIYRPGVLGRTVLDSYKHQWILNRGVSGQIVEKVLPAHLYYNEFRRLVGDVKFDHAINFGGYNDFWSLLFAFSRIKNKSIYLHNDMMEEFNKKIKGKFKHKKNLKVIFSIYKYYDRIISVAESTHETNMKNLEQLVPDSHKKMTYVNNLVDSNRVKTLMNQYDYIEVNGNNYLVTDQLAESVKLTIQGVIAPEEVDVNFVTVGRLSPEKGHEKLIHAFWALYQYDQHIKLYIVGEGPLKESLQSLIKKLKMNDRIILVGQLSNPFALINQCDCFVLSSNYEGQGLVLLETLIIGKPIIATDVTGVRSVLKEGYGELVENNQEALAEKLIQFVERYRQKCLPKRSSFHDEQYNQEALNQFYGKVLGKSL